MAVNKYLWANKENTIHIYVWASSSLEAACILDKQLGDVPAQLIYKGIIKEPHATGLNLAG